MKINEQLIKSHSSLFVFNLPNYKREYSIIADLIDSNQSKMESVSVNFFANSQFNYVQAELDLISEEAAKANFGAPSSMKDIYGTRLPWPLVLVLFMMISQQLRGMNDAMFYSTAMYF
uniref:Uncharacterized protein n=1 Tax=Meloidogyne javanica TaxID=6303 RepID=A0A915M550_MELJA